jgi:Na+:H+ antiporter, NhaA family
VNPHRPGVSASEPYPLERLFGRVLSPLERFLRQATAGGIVLVATTALALGIANSPWGEPFARFWEQRAGLQLGAWTLEQSLHHWTNDGLMALFFLLVGLELKREALVGELSSLENAALPMVAAAGGMVVPALIYLSLNPESPAARGWGIPMATDIAFAIGILVLLAWRVPRALIVFLMALAIADDLGAVLVIALFYTGALDGAALVNAIVALAALMLLNRGGVRRRLPYWMLGVLLWYFTLLSGIHATVAGVLLAFTIPVRPSRTPQQFDARVSQLLTAFRAHAEDRSTPSDPVTSHDMAAIAAGLEHDAKAVQSPLQRTEHGLGGPVTFVILPLFALANAGIDFRHTDLWGSLSHSITLGIALGLVLGKFSGIAGFSWLAIRLGVARLPPEVTWSHLLGAAWLGGIGFTMSLFISQLAFEEPQQVELAKIGILSGSLVAALIGLVWLLVCTSGRQQRVSRPAGHVDCP